VGRDRGPTHAAKVIEMPNERSWHWVSLGHIANSVASLKADQRGGVAIMMGLLFPVLLAVLGLGFEISNWYLKTRAMQNAADAAVIAAASNGEDNYNVEAAAVAANYGFVDGSDHVSVTASNNATCPAGDDISPPCYSVTISSGVPLFLSQFVGYTGDTTLNGAPEKLLTSAAVAVQTTKQQPICLLTLSQSGQGIRSDGAPNSNFSGCSVMSDSASTCNGSDLNATYGFAAGTNSGCGKKQKSNIPVVPDPYAALAINIPANTCGSGTTAYPQEPQKKNDPPLPSTNRWSGNKAFTGAVQMCGDLQLTGDVVLTTPDSLTGATLVIQNGQLDLNGHTLSTANGSALTIVFSGTAGNYSHALTDNSNGQGGVINIQAPSSPLALFPGIAIYQDPALKSGVNITYQGNNPAWDITGAVYLPNSNVIMSGNVNKSSNGADCFVMITNTVRINGTSNIYQQSPAGEGCKQAGLKMPTATIPGRSQLVY
jgi:Putative Flp pilus-assembly TadE/G-like